MQKKVFLTIGRWHHLALIRLLIPTAVWAAKVNTSSIHYPTMIMGLLGGLALFLYGMDKMSNALKNAAGSRLKSLLARLTTNRVAGIHWGRCDRNHSVFFCHHSAINRLYFCRFDVADTSNRRDHGGQYWHHGNVPDCGL